MLFLSLAAIVLLQVGSIEQSLIWRLGSAVLLVFGVPWLIMDWRKVLRFSPSDRALVSPYVIYPFSVLATVTMFLQFLNAVYWGYDLVMFFALVVQLLFAFQQFILLLSTGVRDT